MTTNDAFQEGWEWEYVMEEGDGGCLGVYVRGHHDLAEAFAKAVAEGCDDDGRLMPQDVCHTAYRKVPGVDGWFWLIEGTGRGAFPVTLVDYQAGMTRRYHATRAPTPPEKQSVGEGA